MQRYFSSTKNSEYLELSKDDIRHITVVMRMKENDKIEIVYKQNVYLCCIENVNSNLKFKIEKQLKKEFSKNPFITLIIPVLKENKIDLILQKSTELGVNEIIIIPFERSNIKVDKNKYNKKMDRWNRIVKEASEQSLRNTIPSVSILNSLKDIINIEGLNLICSTSEKTNNIKNVFENNKNSGKINLVIGPEGGISPKEETYLTDNGFVKITLCKQILRVETVPLYLMSVINYEFME